jgi:hypothetical protein
VPADKVCEDPRCDVMLAGPGEQGAILVTIQDPASVDGVVAGLKSVFGSDVPRVQMVDPRGKS